MKQRDVPTRRRIRALPAPDFAHLQHPISRQLCPLVETVTHQYVPVRPAWFFVGNRTSAPAAHAAPIMPTQPHPIQRLHPKLKPQQRKRILCPKHPILQPRLRPYPLERSAASLVLLVLPQTAGIRASQFRRPHHPPGTASPLAELALVHPPAAPRRSPRQIPLRETSGQKIPAERAPRTSPQLPRAAAQICSPANYSAPTPAPLSTTVPGVNTRVTSRRTIFFVSFGSSICSHRATR